MPQFMNTKDPAVYSNTQGSFNGEMSGKKESTEPASKNKSLGGLTFSASTEFGSGKESFPSKTGGLVSPTMKGAEDNSLIKNYSK